MRVESTQSETPETAFQSERGKSLAQASRPTPANRKSDFDSGSGMRKILFQVIRYKPFRILVESFAREMVVGKPVCCPFQDQLEFPGTRI